MQTEEELRQLAIRRLKKKRDFAAHLVSYFVINAFLVGIWYFVAGRGYFWPGWVLLGWGIGLVLNAWEVYGRREISETDIQHEMERNRGGTGTPLT
jgi:fatty acid desaturase